MNQEAPRKICRSTYCENEAPVHHFLCSECIRKEARYLGQRDEGPQHLDTRSGGIHTYQDAGKWK